MFARKGFDGASIRDITREAGANLGAVTYHFGSKRSLYAAVLVHGLTPMVDRVGEASRAHGTPTERLGRVVEVFFEHLAANPDLPRLMLQEVAAGRKPPPELVGLVQRNLGHVTAILTEGWREGDLRPGHPVLTALSVVSLPVYLTIMAPMLREVGGLDLSDPAVRATAVHHVKEFVRRGLAAPQESPA
jgi:AcrR family transcriptional regulator